MTTSNHTAPICYPTTAQQHPRTGLIYVDSTIEYARDQHGNLIYRSASPYAEDAPWLLGDERNLYGTGITLDSLPRVCVDD